MCIVCVCTVSRGRSCVDCRYSDRAHFRVSLVAPCLLPEVEVFGFFLQVSTMRLSSSRNIKKRKQSKVKSVKKIGVVHYSRVTVHILHAGCCLLGLDNS